MTPAVPVASAVSPPRLRDAGISRAASDLLQTPVLLACADHGPHIPLPFVEESAGILSRSNAALTKQIFRSYDHAVFPEEIAWLSERISGWKNRA